MGWSGGSAILGAVADHARGMAKAKRRALYEAVIVELEEQDADSLGECEGMDPVLDDVLLEREHIFADEEEAE